MGTMRAGGTLAKRVWLATAKSAARSAGFRAWLGGRAQRLRPAIARFEPLASAFQRCRVRTSMPTIWQAGRHSVRQPHGLE